MQEARARVAARRGELHGWRPLTRGDVTIVALQVLGVAQGEDQVLGLRVVVAARTVEAMERHGKQTLEWALRKRAVIGDDDTLHIVHQGDVHAGARPSDNLLDWPWRPIVIHVPMHRLPAIAGLVTDEVPTGP